MRSAFPALLLLTACAAASTAPDPLAQKGLPAPQAVTSVDWSPDGRFIVATTLGFRQDPNVWILSSDGAILFGRHVDPWAPFQGTVLDGGKAVGAGLAYSRVTGPLPTISLFGGPKDEETVLEDSLGEWGWLRYGAGDWRTGWTASLIGDLLVRAGDATVTVRGHNGAVRQLDDGTREKYALGNDRPFRMSASADGRAIAMGYIVPEPGSGLHAPPALLAVGDAATAKVLWKQTPSQAPPPGPELPQPARDFPALAEKFKMTPDAVVPFRVAASVSANADGSRVAAAEYGGRLWVRKTPAIGGWNPPYHVIPFVPRQRGRLVLASAGGTTTLEFPEEGLFEVVSSGDRVWAFPMSWFARGSAGAAWLPADPDARRVYVTDGRTWTVAGDYPDAVADVAVHPDGTRALVSCWDGRLYGTALEVGAPARLRWSRDGRAAVVGTAAGDVLCLDASGAVRWRLRLPSQDPPAETNVKPVFEGIPIYQVGRTGKEHAYVGDTWLVKTAEGGFLVDAGGSSSLPHTLARIRAAGTDPASLHDLLHTHSHGDHAGGAYLWRSMGLRIVAPESAEFALAWLMPTLTDYGVWVPRPVDVRLPLKRAGDEAEFSVAGVRIRAVFVPGHSMDLVIYLLELGGKRIAFTGDLGFVAPSDILHRCWRSIEHATAVVEVVKAKVLPFRPDVVFTGHGGHAPGTAFLEDLVLRSEESIRKAR